jgi:hypothetical protein
MFKTKHKHDVVLPGNPIWWVLGSIVGVIGLLALIGAILANTPQDTGGYAEPKAQETAITPDRQESGVRAMADFMVKDGNVIGLRMWARSLGVSSPEFSSAATLREEIKRASDDFAIYRDKNELFKLIDLLGNNAPSL